MRWLRFGIPLALGIAAAAANFMMAGDEAPKGSFVRIKQSAKAGTVLDAELVEEMTLSAPAEELEKLKATAIPWNDRNVVVGKPLLRNLDKNDLVFLRDAVTSRGELKQAAIPVSLEGVDVVPSFLQVDDQITFVVRKPPAVPGGKGTGELETVGPFLIVAVGEQVTRLAPDARESRGPAEKIIAVAVSPAETGVMEARFIKLLNARRGGDSAGIVSVIHLPKAAAK